MASEFIAYIDESGDDGFYTNPLNGKGSSRWFVLSALVVRRANDHEVRKCLATVRQKLGRPVNFALHFRDLDHNPKKAYLADLGKVPSRTVSVVAHKFANPGNPNPFTQKDQFYRYMIRLLLERVSWLCRDNSEGNGHKGEVELIFSNRGSMSYADVCSYLSLLKTKPSNQVRIDWDVIDPANVDTKIHSQLAGLQAVDAVAYSTYAAVEKNKYGMVDTGYLEMIKGLLYRHKDQWGNQTFWNYGLKLWPDGLEKTVAANPYLKELAALK